MATKLFTLEHKHPSAFSAEAFVRVDSTWSIYARPNTNQMAQGRNL
jgi:hypothetical protein